MIEARQIRAARALLDWTRDDLAKASGVSVPALTQIEGEHRTARGSSLDKIRASLEAAGVVFTDNMGVKMKSDLLTVYEDTEGYKNFANDLYETALRHRGEFYLSGGWQDDFHSRLGKEFLAMHAERMQKIDNFKVLLLKSISRADEAVLPHIEYRLIPDQMFFDVPFYVYHDKLAIIVWEPRIRIVVLHDTHVANAYATQFKTLWRLGRPPEKRAPYEMGSSHDRP